MKSAASVYGATALDPRLFSEKSYRSQPAVTRLERSLIEAEQYVADLAEDHPHLSVATLRFADVAGDGPRTALGRLLDLPFVPSIFGFDPSVQFVHSTDVVDALRFAVDQRLEGCWNVAGAGLLPWSELVALAGKRRTPLPAVGTLAAAGTWRLLGGPTLGRATLDLLRYGRGLDTDRLGVAGFRCRYDTAAAVSAPSGPGAGAHERQGHAEARR